jgi:hypothetical protein
MAKLRGVLPSVETRSTSVNVPLSASMPNTAMVLSPRFEP